jgi:hypothetical protein
MLFARAACAVGVQAVVAAVFGLRASPTPWHDAEPWLRCTGLVDSSVAKGGNGAELRVVAAKQLLDWLRHLAPM